ncbi:MAG TPA: hypothetical protein VF861_13915 [Telluria sp.]
MQTEGKHTLPAEQFVNRRRDWHTRSIVQAGIELGKTQGVGPAAVFLRSKRIPLSIALRVLFGTRPQTIEPYDSTPAARRPQPISAGRVIDAGS